jgi:hypothetical protein
MASRLQNIRRNLVLRDRRVYEAQSQVEIRKRHRLLRNGKISTSLLIPSHAGSHTTCKSPFNTGSHCTVQLNLLGDECVRASTSRFPQLTSSLSSPSFAPFSSFPSSSAALTARKYAGDGPGQDLPRHPQRSHSGRRPAGPPPPGPPFVAAAAS